MERIVGQRLIDRPGRSQAGLADRGGRTDAPDADAIAARLQAAQADLVALDAGESGPLRIGTYQSVGAKILPALLREFTNERPQVDITLRESADDQELCSSSRAASST